MEQSSSILVTGGGGFIGQRLCLHLARAGLRVAAPARNALDLLDRGSVAQVISQIRPATVFHLACGSVAASASKDRQSIANEVNMTVNLVSALTPGTRLVVAGSMAEYGRSGILSEDDRCDPDTEYALAKLASSHAALIAGASHGIAVTVARLFGVYGPGEAAARLFPALLSALKNRMPVDLSDGSQQRDFVHVDDACRLLMALANAPLAGNGIVNAGTGVAVRLDEVCLALAREMDAPASLLRFGARARNHGDKDLLIASTARMLARTGFMPPQRLLSGPMLPLFDPARMAGAVW